MPRLDAGSPEDSVAASTKQRTVLHLAGAAGITDVVRQLLVL